MTRRVIRIDPKRTSSRCRSASSGFEGCSAIDRRGSFSRSLGVGAIQCDSSLRGERLLARGDPKAAGAGALVTCEGKRRSRDRALCSGGSGAREGDAARPNLDSAQLGPRAGYPESLRLRWRRRRGMERFDSSAEVAFGLLSG
jgi:hypothetical protein